MTTSTAITRGIQIDSIDLVECSFKEERSKEKGNLVPPECKPEYKFYRRKDRLICTLSVSLAHGKRRAPFQATVTYRATYTIAPDTEVDVARFAKYTAPAHLYPYIREHISDLTRRNSLPPFTMQPVNIARFLDMPSKKKSSVIKKKAVKP